MSAPEIGVELPKLNPIELQLVRERISELRQARPASKQPPTGWGRAMLDFAKAADDLPPDLSLNHDHYLYGTAKITG